VNFFLVLLLLWASLTVLLYSGARLLQGSFYNEPVSDLYWRAPAAAAVLTGFLGVWCLLDRNAPGQYAAIHQFSPTDDLQFKELKAVIRKDNKEQTVEYRLRSNERGQSEYRETKPPYRPLPSHPEAIIIDENGAPLRFEPERDASGHFRIAEGQALRYTDAQGRVMSEDTVGRISIFHWSRFLSNLALNGFHLVLWFVCLWLLVRFQWTHALGLAVAIWLGMTLLILPMLLGTGL
jgi:hypothetical protein